MTMLTYDIMRYSADFRGWETARRKILRAVSTNGEDEDTKVKISHTQSGKGAPPLFVSCEEAGRMDHLGDPVDFFQSVLH